MNRHIFDREAWGRLDVFNQMGNIGSEVGRALNAKRKGDMQRALPAFCRGMDLINATVEAWVTRGDGRVRELLQARELFAESILTDRVDEKLEEYFMQFAVAARLRHLAQSGKNKHSS